MISPVKLQPHKLVQVSVPGLLHYFITKIEFFDYSLTISAVDTWNIFFITTKGVVPQIPLFMLETSAWSLNVGSGKIIFVEFLAF